MDTSANEPVERVKTKRSENKWFNLRRKNKPVKNGVDLDNSAIIRYDGDKETEGDNGNDMILTYVDQQIRSEALLRDVLHCVHNTIGSHQPHGTWLLHNTKLGPISNVTSANSTATVAADGEPAHGVTPHSPITTGGSVTSPCITGCDVTYEGIKEELKCVFNVDDKIYEECLKEAVERQAPEIVLNLTVHEAKDLRAKSVSGSVNPYVTAAVALDSHCRTLLVQQTRHPEWNQSFTMKLRDIHKETLKLQVWHEHEHLGVGAVKDVKDLRGLGRLVKGTATHEEKHLLGEVNLPLKRIPGNELHGWFALTKEILGTPSSLNKGLSSSTINLDNGGAVNTSAAGQTIHNSPSITSGLALLKSSASGNSNNNLQHQQPTSDSSNTSTGPATQQCQQGIAILKPRGDIRISLSLGPRDAKTSSDDGCKEQIYETLLMTLVLHYLTDSSNSDAKDEMDPKLASLPQTLWNGCLPLGALCALHLVSLVHGVGAEARAMALWRVACRVEGCATSAAATQGGRAWRVDAVWLNTVLTAALNEYHRTNEQISSDDTSPESTLRDSLLAWVAYAEGQLSTLDQTFYSSPTSSGIIAHRQLSGILKTLRLLSQHSVSKQLLLTTPSAAAEAETAAAKARAAPTTVTDIDFVVRRAVEKSISVWWIGLWERELKDSLTPEEQVKRVIIITDECYLKIENERSLYSPVFVNDFGLPYLSILYLFITKKLNPCVRPLLKNIENRLLSDGADTKAKNDTAIVLSKNDYTLNAGTSLWQLYVNLGRIHRQGMFMSEEVRRESGLTEYHQWFIKGVVHWLQIAQIRTKKIITRAVEADHLIPCDDYSKFSSSSTETITVFIAVRNWWQELAWPDPINNGVLLGKILKDLCTTATFYCDLLWTKVDSMYYVSQKNSQKVCITKEICIGLNNIERVRDEVAKLAEYFHIKELLTTIERVTSSSAREESSCSSSAICGEIKNGGTEAAQQISKTIDTLISSALKNMDAKVTEFVETVVNKLTGTLDIGLSDACERNSTTPLLEEVLDPSLSLMRQNLQEICFKRFLLRLWDVLLIRTRILVLKNAKRKSCAYYQGVHDILCSSLQFFTPQGGLPMDQAMNDDYNSLLELLGNLSLPSELLASRYYSVREEEQQLMSVTSRGEIFVTDGDNRCSVHCLEQQAQLAREQEQALGGHHNKLHPYMQQSTLQS